LLLSIRYLEKCDKNISLVFGYVEYIPYISSVEKR
jgi:hypothetical protein